MFCVRDFAAIAPAYALKPLRFQRQSTVSKAFSQSIYLERQLSAEI
ncbi:MAG: hypothetical protein AAF171_23495 [Cyanobacteria bacterium P01_A01_bin.116]